ncbi:MAG: alpha/beta fold hydrolase [Actinomycetota bacterium]
MLIPPLMQSAQSWARAGYVERFAIDHQVIAVDPLGHGDSDKPHDTDAYGSEPAVAHVVEVLETEGVQRAVCWGYGLGGETALDLARRRPDLVAAVVVGGVYLDDYAAGMRAAGQDLAAVIRRSAAALETGDWEGFFDVDPGGYRSEQRSVLAAENDPLAIAAIVRSGHHRQRGFMKPAAPSFVYWASDDWMTQRNERLVERFPVDWKIVPGNRMDAFEVAEPVCDAVRHFLQATITV